MGSCFVARLVSNSTVWSDPSSSAVWGQGTAALCHCPGWNIVFKCLWAPTQGWAEGAKTTRLSSQTQLQFLLFLTLMPVSGPKALLGSWVPNITLEKRKTGKTKPMSVSFTCPACSRVHCCWCFGRCPRMALQWCVCVHAWFMGLRVAIHAFISIGEIMQSSQAPGF